MISQHSSSEDQLNAAPWTSLSSADIVMEDEGSCQVFQGVLGAEIIFKIYFSPRLCRASRQQALHPSPDRRGDNHPIGGQWALLQAKTGSCHGMKRQELKDEDETGANYIVLDESAVSHGSKRPQGMGCTDSVPTIPLWNVQCRVKEGHKASCKAGAQG